MGTDHIYYFRKKNIFLILFFLIGFGFCNAQSLIDQFNKAKDLLEKAKVAEKTIETVKEGIENGNLGEVSAGVLAAKSLIENNKSAALHYLHFANALRSGNFVNILRSIPIYDPKLGSIIYLNDYCGRFINEIGLSGSVLGQDPIGTGILLIIDKDLLLNVKLILFNNEWVSLNEVRSYIGSDSKIRRINDDYYRMKDCFTAQNVSSFQEALSNFQVDVNEYNNPPQVLSNNNVDQSSSVTSNDTISEKVEPQNVQPDTNLTKKTEIVENNNNSQDSSSIQQRDTAQENSAISTTPIFLSVANSKQTSLAVLGREYLNPDYKLYLYYVSNDKEEYYSSDDEKTIIVFWKEYDYENIGLEGKYTYELSQNPNHLSIEHVGNDYYSLFIKEINQIVYKKTFCRQNEFYNLVITYPATYENDVNIIKEKISQSFK